MQKIILVGCSTAGMTAARKIKSKLGDQVTIIGFQKLPYVTLKASGLPNYVGADFDDERKLFVNDVDYYSKVGIMIKTQHEVLSINRQTKTVTVKNLQSEEVFDETYDKLIIATGAKPKRLALDDGTIKNLLTLNNMEDAIKMRNSADDLVRRVVIVGGGYVGLELTEAFIKQGKEVVLVEEGAWLSHGYYDQEIANLMLQHIQEKGVKTYLNSSVAQFVTRKDGDIKTVVLTDGTEIGCELVIQTIGVEPNTDFLKATGLKMAPNNGLIVNKQCMTSDPDIYAGGDCALTYSHVTGEAVYSALETVASKHGMVIANNICGIHDEFSGVLRTTILRVFNGDLARTGLTEAQAKAANINYEVVNLSIMDTSEFAPAAAPVTIKVIYDKSNDVLVGAQIFGYNNAVLRIEAFICLIWTRAKIHDCGYIDFPFTPAFSRAVDIMNLILFKLAEK